jgi:hypothetical protein
MLRKAREHRSMALEADARHLFTDVWTSAGVVVGLAVMATGWLWLDPLIAIAVALNILREGGSLVWRSADGLMDRAVEPEVRAADRRRRWTPSATRRSASTTWSRAGRAAPLRRPAHAHAAGLDAGPRGGAAHLGRAGADERRAGLRASIQLLPMDVEAHFRRRQGPVL